MSLVDMHTHTTASDGSYSPTELVDYAIEKKLSAIAITDHDTIAGMKEARAAAKNRPINIVPGIELSCIYNNREIHILGYYVNDEDEEFLQQLHKLRQDRLNRNHDMLKLLQDNGFPITYDMLQNGNKDTVITRAHFARAMVEAGCVKDKNEAFSKYLGDGCPFYLPKPFVSPEEGLGIITKTKGVPVLAHPMLYGYGYQQIEELLQALIPAGLKGIEVYHSNHNVESSRKLRLLADQYHLLPTGGSDFHGSNKPMLDLAVGYGGLMISHSLLEDIKAAKPL